MKTKLLCCAMAFVGSLMMTDVYAQQAIVACNGKNYEQGDTLIIGKPASSGYLFMRTVDEQGSLSSVYERDIDGLKVVITSIPGYDKKLYESMGIYTQPEKPLVVIAEGGGKRFCISLNEALTSGNVMSDCMLSSVEGAVDLTPSILYVYALKLYQTPVDEKVVDKYISLCVPEKFKQASADPFALEEMRKTYLATLQQELGKADFSKVFRLKCLSELQQYDMAKECFPLSGFSCTDVKTKQQNDLSKLRYCLWEECAFHFANASLFTSLPVDKTRAKGFYGMREYARVPAYNKPMATLYVYVKFKNQPVKLPEKKIMVFSKGENFDFGWSTLNKEYGKKSLDMDIIRVDGYNDLLPYVEGEVVYNYLGSITL